LNSIANSIIKMASATMELTPPPIAADAVSVHEEKEICQESVSQFFLRFACKRRESLTDGPSYRGLEGEKIYGCFGVVGAGVIGAGDGAGTDSLGWVCVVRVVVGSWSMFL